MGRKKRKSEKVHYLSGANWRDVLTGRAVTRDEKEHAKLKSARKISYKCRDCPFVCRLMRKAGLIRCLKCGAIMDPVIKSPKPAIPLAQSKTTKEELIAERMGDATQPIPNELEHDDLLPG
jgi:hypothetical protein